jgi:predicted RNase H-like HicB family nuclease
MTREFMAVYEKRETNWSAFSPDIPGSVSYGNSLDETRGNLRVVLQIRLAESAKIGDPISRSTTTTVHFPHPSEGHGIEYWIIERLKIEFPPGGREASTGTSSLSA